MRGALLCSGNLVLDILVRPVEQAVWGTTSRVESISQHLGGNGGNTSYTLGKLGVPVRTFGMVGRDAFGEFILDALCRVGVDTSGVRYSATPSSVTAGLINRQGQRLFLHQLGSSQELFRELPDFAGFAAKGVSHFHLGSPFGLPLLRPRLAVVLREARAAGLTTSLDTQWDPLGRWMQDIRPSLESIDLFFMNEDEARALTGAATASGAARELRERGARDVVVKLSRNGCAVFSDGPDIHCPAFEVPCLDSTGAGDCFVGGFLAARHRGLPNAEAARVACAVAALGIQQIGGTEGVRGFEETVEWAAVAPRRALESDTLLAGTLDATATWPRP